jgi:hypothetical protein
MFPQATLIMKARIDFKSYKFLKILSLFLLLAKGVVPSSASHP